MRQKHRKLSHARSYHMLKVESPYDQQLLLTEVATALKRTGHYEPLSS